MKMDDVTKKEKKEIFPIFFMGCFFIIINGFALLLSHIFINAGMEVFEQADNPMNLVWVFATVLGMTIIILLIAKFWKKQLIQLIILFAVGYTSFYIFLPLFSLVIFNWVITVFLSIILAACLVVVLVKYPEWYIIDLCGIIIGAGAVALFGISLSIFLTIILLFGLAIYDAISVYKTKHMIDLADTVMDLKLPVLLVVPKIRHYSLLKETKRLKEKLAKGEEREAFFIGLGDVVMPGILVAATYINIPGGLSIALSTLAGTLIGFVALMTFVLKGKPQAGLPLLCGGAIIGYIVSCYVFFGHLVGLSLPF
jgi:presenilin-like A22 family membrane protease